MALSEHEEALLQQMEEALYAEDPRFASRIRKTKSRAGARGRMVVGAVAGVAGLALVVLSAMISMLWIGAVGFAVMVAGIVYAITPSKTTLAAVGDDGSLGRPTATAGGRGRGGRTVKGSAAAKSGTFMERIEQRWERRKRDQW
ncbi:MAG: DUF3040 domain-containing protein [Terracoccus sp.]